MYPVEILICRIFEQAIEDYQLLMGQKLEAKRDQDFVFSIQEIENFFLSRWCGDLLKMIATELTGKDVLHRVQIQCASE